MALFPPALGLTNVVPMLLVVRTVTAIRAAAAQQLCSTKPHEPPHASPPALMERPATRGFVVGVVVGILDGMQGVTGRTVALARVVRR
jgi:uncharacterized membrane protein YfcA